ncbi:MAG: hypothetical protein ACW98J_04130 [Candidatus Thorarchaeota archaeon]
MPEFKREFHNSPIYMLIHFHDLQYMKKGIDNRRSAEIDRRID